MSGPIVSSVRVIDLRVHEDDGVGFVDPHERSRAIRAASSICNVTPGGTVVLRVNNPYPPDDVVRCLREYASAAGRVVVQYEADDSDGEAAWERAIKGRR